MTTRRHRAVDASGISAETVNRDVLQHRTLLPNRSTSPIGCCGRGEAKEAIIWISELGLAVRHTPVCRGRLVLAVTLPRNVNRVALLASPLFRLELRAECLNFLSVHFDHVVRNPVRLIT